MIRPYRRILGCLLAIFLTLPITVTVSAWPGRPTQPTQPTDGPGGSNYTYANITMHQYGNGSLMYWVFEPANPTPATAPVIYFLHGYAALTPKWYQAWITHLVRRGNIVIYPRYQAGLFIGVPMATDHALRAIRNALTVLESDGHVHPDVTKVAVVGHSLGGGITAEIAAKASSAGIPQPRAVMPVEPYINIGTMLKDYHAIPATTLLVVVVGKDDHVVGNASAKAIYYTADQVPANQKNYVIMRSDFHGSLPLLGDHGAPVCIPNTAWTDAMDYYATWKLFDGLTDYAFYGTHQEYCFGNTSQLRYMGLWSDGTPVHELIVNTTP